MPVFLLFGLVLCVIYKKNKNFALHQIIAQVYVSVQNEYCKKN